MFFDITVDLIWDVCFFWSIPLSHNRNSIRVCDVCVCVVDGNLIFYVKCANLMTIYSLTWQDKSTHVKMNFLCSNVSFPAEVKLSQPGSRLNIKEPQLPNRRGEGVTSMLAGKVLQESSCFLRFLHAGNTSQQHRIPEVKLYDWTLKI